MATKYRGYIKKATTYKQQIEILKSRDLKIEDEEFALSVLKRVNYYRLSAYMLTYKNKEGTYDNASFESVYSLYTFDKKLRNLLLPLLEDIEIAFRTHISYHLAHKYGPFGYGDSLNFKNKAYHQTMLSTFDVEVNRSDEIFVSHHKKKYSGQFPVWVMIEVASFGVLSKMYSNLHKIDQDEIANIYKIKGNYLKTWLHALSNLRNKCAHYGRLYNRKLTVTPKLFKSAKKEGVNSNTIFGDIYVMGRLLLDKVEWDNFVTNLSDIIQQHEIVEMKYLGFPKDWENILRTIHK